MLSVVIPVYNEAENLLPLTEEVTDALLGLEDPWEILFVDDGSADATPQILAELASKEERIKVLRLRRNFGQTAAMMAGLDHASGGVIVVLDGDGQNDPADIPLLLETLAQGFDIVSGWRRDRHDGWLRTQLSKLANGLISRFTGVQLHDIGCSLKAYRREVIRSVRLYGEMHRFVPIYASWWGAAVTEVPVNHRARTSGSSNYGFERILKVFLDLLVVQFLGRYETRPMYVFGGFGLVSWGISLASAGYAFYRKFFDATDFIQTPLPLLAVMTFVTGVLSILMGLLAELLVRTYYESQERVPYAIKTTHNLDEAD
ncbi:MAG: glycosyltransferase family 2 protein [Deltaproteobacteria bacterium]|nr:glycosyltransferase family 2 protein [Deltaproteobacteria bacterium]